MIYLRGRGEEGGMSTGESESWRGKDEEELEEMDGKEEW